MTILHRLELWLTIKLLERRLERQLDELRLVDIEWTYYINELTQDINELNYLLSGLRNELRND